MECIEIKNLTKTYGRDSIALYDVNLLISQGKIVGLLGPNGAGKTTLIKILAGIIKNYSGEVLIKGNKVGVETKKCLAYLPDCDILDPSWSVSYAISYYQDFFNDFDKEKATSLMNKLDISLTKKIKSLSKGTREKVQLILTLSRQSDIYIFDEPIVSQKDPR